MKNKNFFVAGVILCMASGQLMAVDLGEFNGTKLAIGGYIKAEGIFNNPDATSSTFDSTMRQSRINFKASKTIDGHAVSAFVESDFWGDFHANSSYNMRLRHATIQVDNLTVGQTWNGQFFAVAPLDGEMINFWGLGAGTIAGNGARVRRDLNVHYAVNGFRFTAQDPVYTEADSPDLVVSYTKRAKNGSGLNIAVTGREVENGSSSDYGAGISIAGKLMVGKDSIHLSTYTGEGMGVYSGVGVNGAWKGDATIDAEGGDLVGQTGFAAAYKHVFSNQLRGTLRYGQVDVDDVADSTLKMTTANLIYTYLPGLDLGIEWRDQNIDTLNFGPFPNVRPEGQQVEIMAMYKF